MKPDGSATQKEKNEWVNKAVDDVVPRLCNPHSDAGECVVYDDWHTSSCAHFFISFRLERLGKYDAERNGGSEANQELKLYGVREYICRDIFADGPVQVLQWSTNEEGC